jgi:inner membrane protein
VNDLGHRRDAVLVEYEQHVVARRRNPRILRAADDHDAGAVRARDNCADRELNDPLVRDAIRRDPALRKFLRWSILPLAEVERSRCSVKVEIGDARYQDFRSRSRLSRESVVPTGARDC